MSFYPVFLTSTISLGAAALCVAALAQTPQNVIPHASPIGLEDAGTAAAYVPPPAAFERQTQSGQRYRWLAQSVSQGGTHGKDCEANKLTLPWVSYEDAGAPSYKNPNDPSLKSFYSPSTMKAIYAGGNFGLNALKHQFPKFKGQVYGFDADGKRTAQLVLNADLLNIRIHNEGACMHPQYPVGTAADRAERDRQFRYSKAVQALFQDGAYRATDGAPAYAALKKTVVFSNDSADVPHVPQVQPAPADIAAKLNARLKAKLARDLEREKSSLQQQIAALKSPAGLAQAANRTLNGRAPTAAENAEEVARVSAVHQMALDQLPANIDVVFNACPALQYALDAQASRMLYMLRCLQGVFGFYEQSSNGDMVLVKIADRRTSQQKQAGWGAHPFVSGIAKFHLWSWTEPYADVWRQRWLLNQNPATRRTTPDPAAAKYVKGKIHDDGHYTSFYVFFHGVFDLLPMRTVPLAQIYVSSSGHHETPMSLEGFEPGAKPGDAWTVRQQTWPTEWVE